MHRRLYWRLRVEIVISLLSVILLALTAVVPDWFEALTGVEPDAGSGSFELILSATLVVVVVGFGLQARRDHGRLAAGQM